MNSDVSALILHFRNAASTQRCVDSLIDNGMVRIQLVDNSEDGGKSLKELILALHYVKEKGVRAIVAEPGRNLGFAAGVDTGLKAIRDNFGVCYVLLINADATLQSGSLQTLMARAKQLANPAALAPTMMLPNGSKISWVYYHRLLGLITSHWVPGAFKYLSGCCLLLTPALATTRVFDPRFFFYGDDIDLGYRALMEQVTLEHVPDAVVLHEGSGASRKGSMFYEYHIPRSHLELVRTLTHSNFDRKLATAGRLITLFLRALLRTYRFHSWMPLRGLAVAWSDYRRMRISAFTPKM